MVVGFSTDNITIPPIDNGPGQGRASGTLSTMSPNDNNTIWTGTFTPTFPNTEDWTNTLRLEAASYTDVDNNTGTAVTSPNYMIDDIYPSTKSAPTLTLSSQLLLHNQDAELTLVFPEPVVSFSSDDDINLDNATGSLDNMTTSDNITWTGTFTPTTDMEVASNTITLGTSWNDQVGNPMTGASVTTSNFEVETLRPVANNLTFSVTQGTTYNGTTPGLKIGDNATLTVVFSEPVVSFSSANITVANGMLRYDEQQRQQSPGLEPSLRRTMYNCLLTRFRLTLDTSYTDIVGNPAHIEVNSSYYVVDTRAPSVSSLQLTDGVTTISTFTDRCLPVTSNIIVTFSEAMVTSYITTSTSDTYCTASAAGSILVSSNNFCDGEGCCVQNVFW